MIPLQHSDRSGLLIYVLVIIRLLLMNVLRNSGGYNYNFYAIRPSQIICKVLTKRNNTELETTPQVYATVWSLAVSEQFAPEEREREREGQSKLCLVVNCQFSSQSQNVYFVLISELTEAYGVLSNLNTRREYDKEIGAYFMLRSTRKKEAGEKMLRLTDEMLEIDLRGIKEVTFQTYEGQIS